MISVNSLSGGKTSSYIAANYPADYDVFSLVRVDDRRLLFPDAQIRQQVEDRIGKPFIGTVEDNTIIYTMLDLEQHIGRPITWVSGATFEEAIKYKSGYLPNIMTRYCTSEVKMKPIFYWWAKTIGEPVDMRIGFRANEQARAKRMLERLGDDGLDIYKATFQKHADGRNKWEDVSWRVPSFPLITDNVLRDQIERYWSDKNVRFAAYNNCVGCFHRNPMFLNFMYQKHPEKIEWFAEQEKEGKGTWRSDVTYKQIMKYKRQIELFEDDFSNCDSGSCGL